MKGVFIYLQPKIQTFMYDFRMSSTTHFRMVSFRVEWKMLARRRWLGGMARLKFVIQLVIFYYLINRIHFFFSVFIERRVAVKQRECEHFLRQLVDLEDYMQQGIPVVSRFLFEYICTWDGLEYRECIYRLLERITFKSFDGKLESSCRA